MTPPPTTLTTVSEWVETTQTNPLWLGRLMSMVRHLLTTDINPLTASQNKSFWEEQMFWINRLRLPKDSAIIFFWLPPKWSLKFKYLWQSNYNGISDFALDEITKMEAIAFSKPGSVCFVVVSKNEKWKNEIKSPAKYYRWETYKLSEMEKNFPHNEDILLIRKLLPNTEYVIRVKWRFLPWSENCCIDSTI